MGGFTFLVMDETVREVASVVSSDIDIVVLVTVSGSLKIIHAITLLYRILLSFHYVHPKKLQTNPLVVIVNPMPYEVAGSRIVAVVTAMRTLSCRFLHHCDRQKEPHRLKKDDDRKWYLGFGQIDIWIDSFCVCVFTCDEVSEV